MTSPLQTNQDSTTLLDAFNANLQREKEDCVILPGGKTRLRGDGSGVDIRHDGVLVSPNVGFVLKTKVLRGKESKIFINICYHDEIERPGQKKKLDDNGNSVEGLNVPLSMSPIRICKDKANTPCLVVDAIVHPSVKGDMEKDQTGAHRDMLCMIIIQCFDQKYPECAPLDPKYKLPRLSYFGYVDSKTGDVVRKQGENTEVYKQNVRARKTQPKIEEITKPIETLKRKKEESKANVCDKVQGYGIGKEENNSNTTKRRTLPTLDFQIKLKMAFGEEMDLDQFVRIAEEQLHRDGKEANLIVPIHKNEGLPLLLDSRVCNTLIVRSIKISTKLPSFNEDTTQVEISAFMVHVTGNDFKDSKLVLPFCVDPGKTISAYDENSSTLTIDSIVASTLMEEDSDVGSQPWILAHALSSSKTKGSQSVKKTGGENAASSESKSSCKADLNECNGFHDPYHTRPIYLHNDHYTANGPKKTEGQNELDVELPEDSFHAKDTLSQHWIHEQEREQKEKHEKRERERQERQSDESVEYVDAKDFKPGGKYYVSKGSRSANESTGRDDNNDLVLTKAEAFIRKKYNSSLSHDLWSKLF